ncbi:DUF211 domain-containing protein [Halobaculum halobium]|uniref:DUF211 domain-containing protein n=1 Tax=Halobaculum halobium TaxID=3032281 RepID=A0ABD5T6C6_9EURY|nr:DUF211 domain-containing protein [Halobaculum sp. SYNS20]
MASVRKVVVDVLKPHAPPLVEFTERVNETPGVDSASSRLIELDREVQNIAVTVEGEPIDYDAVVETIDGLGATVHSVDEVTCGDRPSGDTLAPESDD